MTLSTCLILALRAATAAEPTEAEQRAAAQDAACADPSRQVSVPWKGAYLLVRCARQPQVVIERVEPKLRDAPTAEAGEEDEPSALEALDGYQTAKWGMSKAQVKKLFPKSKIDGARLALVGKVAGFDATTVFLFAKDKLTHVNVLFKPSSNVRGADDLYNVLEAALAKKYGDPRCGDSGLGNGCMWIGPRTGILLKDRMASTSLTAAAVIEYVSVELRELQDEISDQAAKDL